MVADVALLLLLTQREVPLIPAPPPPPPKVIEKKPEPPRQIRVGSQAASAYFGPAMHWYLVASHTTTTERLLELGHEVERNPENICARGRLIFASTRLLPDGTTRLDHILWMIAHHPEWDGFLYGLRLRGPELEPIRAAWREQARLHPDNATLLDHASSVFGGQESQTGAELLKKAILLQPDEAIYREHLGRLYGQTLFSWERASLTTEFTEEARRALEESRDLVLLRAALRREMKPLRMERDELAERIRARLSADEPSPPSWSDRYLKTTCDADPID